jgi:hypothetical protein
MAAPDQAAVCGLDRLSPDHWPKLAANWLAAGFGQLTTRVAKTL